MKYVIAISLLIIALSIGYYLVIFLPNKQKAELDQQLKISQQQEFDKAKAIKDRQANLQFCLQNVHNTYMSNWNGSCKGLSLPDNCSLPSYIASRWDTLTQQDKDECMKIYPQN